MGQDWGWFGLDGRGKCGLPSFGIRRTFYHNWDFCLSLGRGLRKMDWATCSSLKRELPVVVSFPPQKTGLRPHDLSSPTNQPNQSVFGAVL